MLARLTSSKQVDGTVVLLQGQKQQGARDKRISFLGGPVGTLGLQRYQSSEEKVCRIASRAGKVSTPCVKVEGSVALRVSEVGEMVRHA